jgi:hypothetical protein
MTPPASGPEALARFKIDAMLASSGWLVQDRRDMNLWAGRGLAVRESAVEANLARCTRLRQAILKWAFEGRLADQDQADEPASVMLERIKRGRSSGHARKRGRQQP